MTSSRKNFICAFSALLFGCAGKPAPDAAAPAASSASTASPSTSVVVASSAAPAPSASTSDLGIPSCDAYLARLSSCAEKANPKEAGATLLSTRDSLRKAWATEAEKGPETRAQLEKRCAESLAVFGKSFTAVCPGV